MTLPRCRCGRPAITIAPGSEATYAPGHVLIERGKPVRAWCSGCAARRGWLAAPAGTATPDKAQAPRSASTARAATR